MEPFQSIGRGPSERYPVPENSQAPVPFYYQPVAIVILTLTVLGPLAIGLVWRSPVIKRRDQWILTIFILLVTLLVVLVSYRMVVLIVQSFRDLREAMDY